MAQAVITNIQRYSLHDGPGLRTLLFLKGCPLSCLWCSNPETQKAEPELLYSPSQCIACGACAEVCPQGAFKKMGDTINLDHTVCTSCGLCAEECPTGAASMSGYTISIDEALTTLEADVVFFKNSGGGVTISGGEPALYPDFTARLIQVLKQRGIHTAVETCGFPPWESLQAAVEQADLVLYDLKAVDPKLHVDCTGADNSTILENAGKLAGKKELIFRVPIIPGYTASGKNLADIAGFVHALGTGNEVHLLPYHSFGSGKYRGLGKQYLLEGTKPPSEEELASYLDLFEGYSIPVRVL